MLHSKRSVFNPIPTARRMVCALALSAIANCAMAQGFPTKPIRIIVPFAAGSGTDILARATGEKLAAAWGQPVLVENVPGAGGTIGIGQVARAAPDGYTLAVVSTGHVVNPALYPKLSYDLKDLAGVIPLGTVPSVLIAPADTNAKTLRELIDDFKAKPGKYNYGTAGIGSAADVHIAKLRAATGFDQVHVPLRGTPQILVEVMSGRVQLAAVPVTSGLGPIRDKKVVALAVSTRERSSILPGVPTSAEAGFPAAEFNFWFGMLAPAATPRPIINQLNAEITKIMATPEMKDRLEKLGTEPFVLTPERFDAFLADEARTLQAVMRSVGAKAE